MRRRDLPPDLPPVFTPAMARAADVGRSRLRAADLARPFRGLYVRTDLADGVTADPGAQPESDARSEQYRRPAVRLATQFALAMSDREFFSHHTAAVLWDVPLPWRVAATTDLHVSVLRPFRAPAARGIDGHQVDARLISVTTHPSGLRLSSPASTWAQLGTVLGEHDLVAVGDALVREPRRATDRPQLASLAELRAVVSAGRRPGVRVLRRALERIRPRVDSRRETLLRLAIVDAGLPEPVPGFPVVVAGVEVAQVDLAYPDRLLALEYEGEHHLRDPDQWARDIRRYERLADAGWHVIRVTKDDLFRQRPALIGRVRRALA